MIRKSDKKGQEGVGIGTLAVLIIAGIAVVLIILGIYRYYNPVLDLPGTLPSALTVAAQTCKLSSEQNDKISYCSDFKEFKLSGETQYVNCDYIKVTYDTDFEDSSVTCSENVAITQCEQLQISLGDDYKADEILVNGKSCAVWTTQGPPAP